MSEDGALKALSDTRFGEVPIKITISVGVARPRIRELVDLDDDAVLALDRTLDDPVELYVADKLIGRGQLEEIDGEGSGKLGVRILEIAPPQSED